MRAFALVELGGQEAIASSSATRMPSARLRTACGTKPGWAGLLRTEGIKLDERDVSAN
jgi:hypothetical protein